MHGSPEFVLDARAKGVIKTSQGRVRTNRFDLEFIENPKLYSRIENDLRLISSRSSVDAEGVESVNTEGRGINGVDSWPTEGFRLWTSYIDVVERKAGKLQLGCKPRHYPPVKGTRARGIAVLLHGFTGCPQQFFDLAPYLASRGYHVLLPVLPGHGVIPEILDGGRPKRHAKKHVLDRTVALPTPESVVSTANSFAEEINSIVEKFPGDHAIMGIDVGATYAALVTGRNPELWDRQLLVNPLFDLPSWSEFSEWQRNVAVYEGVSTSGLQRFVAPKGWGSMCEEDRENGRSGYCQFELKHVLANEKLSSYLKKSSKNWLLPGKVKTQMTAFEGDTFVNSSSVKNAADEFLNQTARRRKSSGALYFCTFEEEACHNIYSRYDDQAQREKSWIHGPGGLNWRTADFLIHGRPIPARVRESSMAKAPVAFPVCMTGGLGMSKLVFSSTPVYVQHQPSAGVLGGSGTVHLFRLLHGKSRNIARAIKHKFRQRT